MRSGGRVLCIAFLLAALPLLAEEQKLIPTLAPHPDTWWWASGQINVIDQYHPPFPSPYASVKSNSFDARAENATSFVATVFLAARASRTTEFRVDVESAGGSGLSDALGLGSFSNLDVVRNPTLGPTPYLARAMIRQIIPLSRTWVPENRGPSTLAPEVPERRLELRAGKFGTADFFDVNAAGSDSHLQFMNWTVDNNGAYDYAADTRGYSFGALLEYQSPTFGVRFGEMLMPTVANGIDFDLDFRHARAENLELEWREHLVSGHPGVIKLLGYFNHARMGSYAETLARYRAQPQPTPLPNITDTARRGRTKLGLGLNVEQEVATGLTVFGRLGWNDGQNETFAYTEVDDTLELGLQLDGGRWHRPQDRTAIALVTNGLSAPHREYLALGGRGFILGDGGLTYGRESVAEVYYTALLWRGLSAAFDAQGILDPGFNQDRGPVLVLSVRLHLEI